MTPAISNLRHSACDSIRWYCKLEWTQPLDLPFKGYPWEGKLWRMQYSYLTAEESVKAILYSKQPLRKMLDSVLKCTRWSPLARNLALKGNFQKSPKLCYLEWIEHLRNFISRELDQPSCSRSLAVGCSNISRAKKKIKITFQRNGWLTRTFCWVIRFSRVDPIEKPCRPLQQDLNTPSFYER